MKTISLGLGVQRQKSYSTPPTEPYDLSSQPQGGRGEYLLFWNHESFEEGETPLEFEIEVYEFGGTTPIASDSGFIVNFVFDPLGVFILYTWQVRAKDTHGLYSQWVQSQLDLS